MTPVLPISKDCCFVSRGNAFITWKDCFQRKCSFRYSTPLSKTAMLFSPFRTECALQTKLRTSLVAATGTDVDVKDADLADEDNEFGEFLESVPVPGETSEGSSIKSDASPISARSKTLSVARKSDMPRVKNEELIPGASFTGKVRSIMPFGAFVDFGAFTDGLVHVSRLSDSFVKDVNDVVSIGQEVTVWLVEANTETGRISLAMEQQKEFNSSSDKSRSPRKSSPQSNQERNETRKSFKFVKGQELDGTVKNLTRSGAFISLPEGEEGFLPTSEEAAEGFGNMLGGTSLQTGQEVKVRVLRFNRGQVTLTMKTEDFAAGADSLIRKGVVHTATNPFAVAFRKNTDLSAFLDEQQIGKESTSEAVIDEFENEETDKVENVIGRHEGQESITS